MKITESTTNDTPEGDAADTHLGATAAAYLRAVEARLGTLDAGERQDLLADLTEHLRELDAEPDVDLAATLGAPERYAAELLASAGLTPATPAAPGNGRIRRAFAAARGRLVAARERLSSFADDNPETRPLWWAARGWFAAHLIALPAGSQFGLAIPRPWGSAVAGTILMVTAVVGSVAWGRRERIARSDVRVVRLATAAVTGAAVLIGPVVALSRPYPTEVYYQEAPLDDAAYGSGCLARADGTPVENIYPYDSSGQLLGQVLLYDQRGEAFDDLCPPDWDDEGRQVRTIYPTDVNGSVAAHAFPRPQYRRDPSAAGATSRAQSSTATTRGSHRFRRQPSSSLG